MKSHDLCIIHLSDLHFSGGIYKTVIEKLVRDIGEEIQHERDIAIVVTGDLVTKNNYPENKENVVRFFKDIVGIIPHGANLLDVEIVPGNHDGLRAIDTADYNGGSFITKLDEYQKLENVIYTEFRKHFSSLKIHECPGINVVEFSNRNIVFCRLNTSSFEMPTTIKKQVRDKESNVNKAREILEAWETKTSKDFENQLSQLAREIQKFTSNNNHREPDLAFVLSHHPLSLLRLGECDTLEQMLYKTNFQAGDVFVSGHVHSANQSFASYNAHQKIMLTTGLGWQEDPNEVQRYSIYRINLDRKTCQISVRSSVSNEDFRQDTTPGHNEEFVRHSHTTLPLRLNSIGAAIHAKSAHESHSKSIYVDVSVVESIPSVLESFHQTRNTLEYKVLKFEEIAKAKAKTTLFAGRIDAFINWNLAKHELLNRQLKRTIVQEHFFAQTINEICLQLTAMLKKLTTSNVLQEKTGKEISAQKVEWRVHARQYKGKRNNKFKQRSDIYVATLALNIEGEKNKRKPSDIPWESLIKAAFETNHGVLINTANPRCAKNDTEWSDFLTCVPRGRKFVKEFSPRNRRPLLTFGISFKTDSNAAMCQCTRLLYMLEYLGIGGLIEDILNLFVEKYDFETNDIIGELV